MIEAVAGVFKFSQIDKYLNDVTVESNINSAYTGSRRLFIISTEIISGIMRKVTF